MFDRCLLSLGDRFVLYADQTSSVTLYILIRDYNVRNDAAVLTRFNDDHRTEEICCSFRFLTNEYISGLEENNSTNRSNEQKKERTNYSIVAS
jgi:hypothetical protein